MPTEPSVADVLIKIVPDLAKWWSDRRKRKPRSLQPNSCFGPMACSRKSRKLARGKGTEEDVKKLQIKLAKSKPKVDTILHGLAESRKALLKQSDGIFLVTQINALISESEGPHGIASKNGLRGRIAELLREYNNVLSAKTKKKRQERLEVFCGSALLVCNNIEAFNAAVARFHRSVFN